MVYQVDINDEYFEEIGDWDSIELHTRLEAVNQYAAQRSLDKVSMPKKAYP